MTYVVTDNCIKCKYMDCIEVCPVDCFYEGENMLVIHPDECIDCGVCEPECPADAIKKGEDGVVQSALKPRCIACSNCVLACPFGIPKMMTKLELMMKCDMCYDRTSVGLKPMCASVCPSGALYFGTHEEIEHQRPRSQPINTFQFGGQTITTKVHMMVPLDAGVQHVDVLSAMSDTPVGSADMLDSVFDEIEESR